MEFPFYSEEASGNSEEILSLVFTDGNFGHLASSKRPRNESYLKRKTNSFLGHISRFRKTRRLFPEESKETFRSMICGGFAQVFKTSPGKHPKGLAGGLAGAAHNPIGTFRCFAEALPGGHSVAALLRDCA